MRFSKAVVKFRVPILIIAIALLIPSTLGMISTRINYDMLDYLPDTMDTVIGQDELMEDFGKGEFSMLVIEDMPVKDVAKLKEQIEQVEHVDSVVWYDSVADLSISIASRVIGSDLNDEEHRKIVERYVNEAGSFNAN